MATNKLTEVAGLVAQAVMGAKVKDKDGNAKTVKPTGDDNLLDLTDISAFGGGSGGTDTDKEHPNTGVDYYAGSLASGEITERNLEWSGTDNPTKDLAVNFIDDPGTKIFGQYDGITILGHIQKIALDKGVVGDISEIDLNYDLTNVKKDGYYTTTTPYPLYIKTENLSVGQTANIPINGIGEGLANSNEKVPELNLTFNSDKTMTINHVMGYSNDGDSAGVTGFNYYFVFDRIATFSTQAAVTQLPDTVNLFTGTAFGNVLLSGPTDFNENVLDGYEITISDQALPASNFSLGGVYGIPLSQGDSISMNLMPAKLSKIRIPKEELIINNNIDISSQLKKYVGSNVNGQYNGIHINNAYSFRIVEFKNTVIKILPKGIIDLNLILHVSERSSNNVDNVDFKVPIIKVTTYKK